MLRDRFTESADAFMASFVASVKDDARLVLHDIDGSRAHAKMLATQELLTSAECDRILSGLDELRTLAEAGRFELRADLEDVHMNVEAWLKNRIGDAADKLHTARSRNDQVALDLRLYVRDVTKQALAGLKAIRLTLAKRAAEHAATVMPGFTHLQKAQPITAGHLLLAWHDALARDAARFEDSLKRTNISPLGAGALATTTLPIDPAAVGRALEFDGVFTNSIDAVSDRDFIVEFVADAALAQTHLSQIAEALVLAQSVGWIELPDALCTTSSMMPQKKNPDMLELVRGKSGATAGALVSLLTNLKALPPGYNRDLQDTNTPLYAAADALLGSLTAVTKAVDAMKLHVEQLAKAADDPALLATDYAEALVKRGTPFRQAHAAVAKWAQHPEGPIPGGVSPVTPAASVAARRHAGPHGGLDGGPAPEIVKSRAEKLLKELS